MSHNMEASPPLEYDTDHIAIAIRETPHLLDYILSIAKKEEVKRISKRYIKNYVIPVGDYKGVHISEVNKEILRRMLTVKTFLKEYPIIYYSVEHYVRTGCFPRGV